MHRNIAVLATAVVLLTPLSLRADPPLENPPTEDTFRCPAGLQSLTPAELWEWRFAAHAAGDIDAVMCTYAPDAVVIMPGMVFRGREEIRAGFEMMFSLFPGAPTLTSVTIVDDVLFVTFHAEGPYMSIPDGADTFVIHNGLIQYQAVHGTMVPTAQ